MVLAHSCQNYRDKENLLGQLWVGWCQPDTISAHSNTFAIHHLTPTVQYANLEPQILSHCVIGNFRTQTETAHWLLAVFCLSGESWTGWRQLSLISFSHSYNTIMLADGAMRCQILAPLCQCNSTDYHHCQIECI